MAAPAPILIPWEKLPKALSGYFRAYAPEFDGVTCQFSPRAEGLLIEPVETAAERSAVE